jgi:hypothetical protein
MGRIWLVKRLSKTYPDAENPFAGNEGGVGGYLSPAPAPALRAPLGRDLMYYRPYSKCPIAHVCANREVIRSQYRLSCTNCAAHRLRVPCFQRRVEVTWRGPGVCFGVGLATSLSRRTSGDPYFVWTTAYICIWTESTSGLRQFHAYQTISAVLVISITVKNM